jgi:hypothetical protein
MSTKSNVSETPSPDLVTVRAICAINDGSASHKPGSVFEVPRKDAELLLKAGAVTMSTDATSVPIEELLPAGMDSAVWRADPRLRVNGQRPSSFVKCEDFDGEFPRADRR